MASAPVPFLGFAFVVGACIGSFLNVCIARWPHDLSVVSPPSRCPRCERAIRWYENIPLVSWLVLRGRCRGCQLPISPIYPAVELLIGLGWLAVFLAFGFDFTALRIAVLGTVLAGIAITDAKHYLIPDGFTVFGLAWVLGTAVVAALIGEAGPFAGVYDAIIGACVGAGAIAIAGWLGEFFLKREAMGFGDVTLMAVVGAAVGPARALLVVFLAAFIGAVVFLAIVYPVVRLRAMRHVASPELPPPAATSADASHGGEDDANEWSSGLPQVPFGVFLAPAALVALLWGNDLVTWYLAHLTTL